MILRDNILNAFNFKSCNSIDDVKAEIDNYMIITITTGIS